LIKSQGQSQWEACSTVSGLEQPQDCGPCDPSQNPENQFDKNEGVEEHGVGKNTAVLQCPACSLEVCESDLNRCPIMDRTFVCTEGPSAGGCSGDPWTVDEVQCDTCCEMTDCLKIKDVEAQKVTNDGNALAKKRCPPCPPSICYGKVNQCPVQIAPFFCINGVSAGGCSPKPWDLSENADCDECCEMTPDC
jgi:hypothetical protein